MKKILLFVSVLVSLQCLAASTPPSAIRPDTLSIEKPFALTPQELSSITGKKMTLLQRLQWKAVQKKWKKQAKENPQKTKETVATLALIAGIAGVILLFVFPVLGFFLMLGGIIMGIIGLTKNPNRKSRTQALIGLIAGSIGIAFITAVIISFAQIFN